MGATSMSGAHSELSSPSPPIVGFMGDMVSIEERSSGLSLLEAVSSFSRLNGVEEQYMCSARAVIAASWITK